MPQVDTGWQTMLTELVSKTFVNRFRQYKSKIGLVASIEKSSDYQEILLDTVGLSDFQEFQGTVEDNTMFEGYSKTIKHTQWASKMPIEYALWQDDKMTTIKRNVNGFARAAKRTKEARFWNWFDQAFSTTYGVGNGEAPCSATHSSANPSAGTRSNYGTLSLSAANYLATRILMRKQKDTNGKTYEAMPDTLLAPVDLENTAYEAVYSALKPGTANNDTNLMAGEFKPKVIIAEFLQDADNWFVIDSEMAKECFIYYNRHPLKLWNDQSSTDLVLQFAGYYRDSFGAVNWEWLYGNQV